MEVIGLIIFSVVAILVFLFLITSVMYGKKIDKNDYYNHLDDPDYYSHLDKNGWYIGKE